MAEKNIDIKGYDVAAFLAHQSIEKLLKAILAFQGKKIPKIHYLDELIKNFDVSEEVSNDINEIVNDYTVSRYPDVSDKVPYEAYNEEISKNRVEKVKKIFNILEDQYLKEFENQNDQT